MRVMRKCVMVRQILFAAAPAFILALGFMTTDVMAGSTPKLAHSAAHSVVKHRRHVAQSEFFHAFGAAPSYVYAPGKGILDEACDLPTSTCPNEKRDVQ
jgi:hypothetical protein